MRRGSEGGIGYRDRSAVFTESRDAAGQEAHDRPGATPASPSSPFPQDFPRPRRRYGARSDLTAIKSILARALAQKGLDQKIERYEFILHWPEIVGDTLAKISKPDHISRRVLLVNVVHSAWAQELTFMKPALLRKLSLYLRKGDVVEDMVFRVGPV